MTPKELHTILDSVTQLSICIDTLTKKCNSDELLVYSKVSRVFKNLMEMSLEDINKLRTNQEFELYEFNEDKNRIKLVDIVKLDWIKGVGSH
jgi:hypothetical protein